MSTENETAGLAPLVEAVPERPPLARRTGPGVLVALSGMDGAGKSSAAAAVSRHLREAGFPVHHRWHRIGEMDQLARVAGPVKRLLRPRRPVAGSLVHGRRRAHGPVAWAWVAVVALETARAYALSAGMTRAGLGVICDRWTTDSLVDLEIRYGRHRLAEWLLRAAAPRVDVEILFEVDAATAAARKPDDQPRAVLDRMQELYARAARRTRARRIDATRPLDEVIAEVLAAVDAALAER